MSGNRFVITLFFLSLLGGCGGGGSSNGGGSGPGPAPAVLPILASIAPSSAIAGAPDLTIQASGTNFANASTVQWNGSSLKTVFVTATQLTATIPAKDLATPGSGEVSVSNPGSQGGNSQALAFTIAAATPSATWVRALNYAPQDIAWDAVHGKILASMGANDPTNPNKLLVIDPISGAVQTAISAGNNPHLLSVSSDASYLWVSQDGDSTVQRYTLPDLQKDISIPLPTSQYGPQQAVSLEAAPIDPHTVALDAGQWTISPSGWNIYVFDDARQRPATVNALNLPYIDWLQWGKDDSILYGTQHGTIDEPGGVVSMAVSASGVSELPGDGGFPGGTGLFARFSPGTGLMYSDTRAADPVRLANVGEYPLEGNPGQCIPDSSTGRFYCLVGPQLYGPGAELWVFDLASFKFLERVDLSHVVTGALERLIRWGNAGLAAISVTDQFYGNGGLFLIDGAAVNPNAASDTASGTATTPYPLIFSLQPESAQAGSNNVVVRATGSDFTPNSVACWSCNFLQLRTIPTTYVSPTQLTVTIPAEALQAPGPLLISVYDPARNSFGTNSLTFTVLPTQSTGTQFAAMNLDGLAMAWDKTRSLLYVGTGGLDRAYPSQVVAVDPTTATVKNSVQVSSFPYLLSMSAQDEFLYVGFWKASLETQLALPGLNPARTWPLSNPAFQNDASSGNQFYAGDLQAAPQNPHTSVATLYNYAVIPPAIGGVTVYDDQIQRPNIVAGWAKAGNDIDTLAWGKTDSILIGSSNDQSIQTDYLFTVASSGVSLRQSVVSNFNALGSDIHSDFGTGLVYSDDGNVADPSTDNIVGSINASGIVVPDSSLNKIFVLGQTQAQASTNQYTIASFDQTTYAFVSTTTVPGLLGVPIALSRCGTHCLAVLTFNPNWSEYGGPVGMLYLISDSAFVSNASHTAASATPLVKGDLAIRWKRLSEAEIMKYQQFHQKD